MNAFDDVERPGENGDGQECQEKGNFVSRQLSSGTDTTDEGVLVVGGPACKENADRSDAKDGDGVENGEVGVGGVNPA